MNQIRTRFAPSPTGFLHIGGIRTALFAWLIARQNNGKFILRLEDTDQKREVMGSAEHVIKSLVALGLDYDEGPDRSGDFGPYRQSERLENYRKWAQILIEKGRAYADPYSPEEVQAFREQAQKNKQPFLYRNHRPDNPPSWDGTTPLRFRSNPQSYTWRDEVMGELHAGAEAIDDFVLIKSDGFPTYNFAHIVDDAEMKITHVIRGQEFIASMPNYLNMYEALELDQPVFATLPHVLNEQGNKKLSKRDGDTKDILYYVNNGYLPEALRSFIATLGWNDGTKQEIFTTDELIRKFSLDRVGKSGAHFDERKLNWVNGHFIRNLTLDDIYTRCQDFLPVEAKGHDERFKKKVVALIQERLKYFAELPELTRFFFTDLPVNNNLITEHKQLSKFEPNDLKVLLQVTRQSLNESNFKNDDIANRLNGLLATTHTKPVILFSLVRIAVTQSPSSPALVETLELLGRETTIRRIDAQLASL